MHPDWARSLRDQCAVAGVPFFFKQWGKWAPIVSSGGPTFESGVLLAHKVISSSNKKRIGKQSWYAGHGPNQRSTILEDVGKARAGRLLDGIEHNAMPEVKP